MVLFIHKSFHSSERQRINLNGRINSQRFMKRAMQTFEIESSLTDIRAQLVKLTYWDFTNKNNLAFFSSVK